MSFFRFNKFSLIAVIFSVMFSLTSFANEVEKKTEVHQDAVPAAIHESEAVKSAEHQTNVEAHIAESVNHHASNKNVHHHRHHNISQHAIEIESDYRSFSKVAAFSVYDHKSLNDLKSWIKIKNPSFIIYYVSHENKSMISSIEHLAHTYHLPLRLVHIDRHKSPNTEVYYISGKKCEPCSLNCSVHSNHLYMLDHLTQLIQDSEHMHHFSFLF